MTSKERIAKFTQKLEQEGIPYQRINKSINDIIRENFILNEKVNEAIKYIENYCIGNLQYENKTHKVLLDILRGEK